MARTRRMAYAGAALAGAVALAQAPRGARGVGCCTEKDVVRMAVVVAPWSDVAYDADLLNAVYKGQAERYFEWASSGAQDFEIDVYIHPHSDSERDEAGEVRRFGALGVAQRSAQAAVPAQSDRHANLVQMVLTPRPPLPLRMSVHPPASCCCTVPGFPGC